MVKENYKQVLRVLCIVPDLGKGSGVMVTIMNYYRHLNRDLVQFDFVCHKKVDVSFEPEIGFLGGRIKVLPPLSCFGIIKSVWEIMRFLKKNQKRYIAIHLHAPVYGFLYLPIAKALGMRNLIVHSHSTSYSNSYIKNLRNRIVCLGLTHMSDYFFSCSLDSAKFWYGNDIFNNDSFRIIPNAIDYTKFTFSCEERRLARALLGLEAEVVFGHIGRFELEKNQSFLLDVFKRIKERLSNALLFIVGDGSLRFELEQKVTKLGLKDSVKFLGIRNDIPIILQAMDCFILPSFTEALPLTLVEAQIAGLPCLASTAVPLEVRFTENLIFLELSESYDEWADRAIELIKKPRCVITGDKVRNSGYDIHQEARNLENFYLGIA